MEAIAALWIAGTMIGLIALVSAFPIYFLAPSRLANRFLSLMLFFEAVNVTMGPLSVMLNSPYDDAASTVGGIAFVAQSPFYLLFIGQALRTPLVRPLAAPAGQATILALLVLSEAALLYYTHRVTDVDGKAIAAVLVILLPLVISSVYGLVAAVSALRRAGNARIHRVRAKAYLIAFASRDLAWISFFAVVSFGLFVRGIGASEFEPWFLSLWIVGELVFVLGLNYGILRFQLFNLDYGIKMTIKGTTVAGIFVAVFFLVQQASEILFQEWLGSQLLGLAASALLLLALAPLRRVADRIAERITPGAKPLRDAVARERLQIYRDQVFVAWEDGRLSVKERRILEVARRRLQVSDRDAHRIEREIVGA